MATEKENPEDASELKFEEKNQVNEATLKLLRFELEKSVRDSFRNSVTIPVGAGGVLGIIVAVFLWIPQKIDTHVVPQIEKFLSSPENQALLNSKIQDQINLHFNDPNTKKEIRDKIDSQTSERIASEVANQLGDEVLKHLPAQVKEELTTYFKSPEWQTSLKKTVDDAVAAYFRKPEAANLVEGLVNEYLKTDGKEILVEQIDSVLRPAADRLSTTFKENRNRLVIEFEPQSLFGEPKRGHESLLEYTSDRNVRRIREKKYPVVLTKTIWPENKYVEDLIRLYLEKFRRAFGVQFKYVAISYGLASDREVLLALVPAERFADAFRRTPADIVKLLNLTNRLTGPEERANRDQLMSKARQQLFDLFGSDVSLQIGEGEKVEDVLTNEQIWSIRPKLTDEVAVVTVRGNLSAVTTRQLMIEGLLGMRQTE